MNAPRAARGVVHLDHNPVQDDPLGSDLKTLRQICDESLDDRLNFPSQHALVRSCESGVAQERRAARENLFVGRLDVGVRAHYRADLAVEHSCKRNLLGSRLRMEIHEDDWCSLPETGHFRRNDKKRIFQRRHEGAPLGVEHGDGRAILHFGLRIAYFKNSAPLSRRSRRIIERTQTTRLGSQHIEHFLLIPHVIARGDDIHAGGKDFGGGLGREAGAARGVLAIGDDKVQPMLFAQGREKRLDGAPTGSAHDVTNEKQVHAGSVITPRCGKRLFPRAAGF